VRIGLLLVPLAIGAGCTRPADDIDLDEPVVFDDFGFPSELPQGIVLHDLGMHESGGDRTAPLSVDIDAAASSFTVVAVSEAGRRIGVVDMVSPSGETVIDIDTPYDANAQDIAVTGGFPGLYASPNRAIVSRTVNTVLVPNNPAVVLEPGTWTFELALFNGQEQPIDDVVEVFVVERRGPPAASATLDVVVHLAGDEWPDAADQPNGRMTSMIGRIDQLLGQAGILLGDVTFVDADGPSAYQLEAECTLGRPAFDAFADLSDPVPGAVNLLLVDTIVCGDGPPILSGLSAGLPGAPLYRDAGVVASRTGFADFQDAWENVVAHELGHFLGLFHVTEDNGFFPSTFVDQIPDTEADDIENLMFPLPDNATGLSDQQIEVLQRSAWL
jgi:hypothetical protein